MEDLIGFGRAANEYVVQNNKILKNVADQNAVSFNHIMLKMYFVDFPNCNFCHHLVNKFNKIFRLSFASYFGFLSQIGLRKSKRLKPLLLITRDMENGAERQQRRLIERSFFDIPNMQF